MAFRGNQMFTLVAAGLVITMLRGGALARSGCTSALVGLAPCLNYISGSSSTPSSSCCSQLASVVQSQPKCLCQVLNGGASSYGVTINKSQALALPGACKVQTPPASQCNAVNPPSGSSAGSPVGSPTSSPADASTPEASVNPDAPTTPTVSSTPAGSGSKASTGSTSAGNMTKSPLHWTLLLLFVTTSATAIITM